MFENDEVVWRLLQSLSVDLDIHSDETNSVRALVTAGVDFFNQKNVLFAPPELQFEPNDGLPA